MLQDYLDGRLSPEERSEFEALLERDAGLAGQVEACREYGRALREDLPELPPGFYTRARARFEQEQAARKPRRFSLFSWELAGLAAAAALAGVLFIPGLVQWDRQGAPFAEEVTTPSWEKKSIAADEAVVEQGKELQNLAAGAAEQLVVEPDEVLVVEEPPAIGRVEEGQDLAPPPAAMPTAPVPAEKREKKGARAVRHREAELGLAMSDEEAVDSYRQPDRIKLPPGVVVAGDLIIIETEQQWRNLIEGPARSTELPSRTYNPGTRWILIGARPERFDCAGIKIVASPDSYRFLLHIAVDPALVAEWGCAIALPRDGRRIEIVSSWKESHE
jgi:anti-sigma-K factor RskA